MPAVIDGDRLKRYEDAAVRYCVPQHVRYIEELAFSGADSLALLEIPDSVEYIGNYAFRMCYGLEEIRLPAEVSYMGAGLFQHCWKLRRISFPEGTRFIGGEMLESCHALTSLELPDSLIKIDKGAFSGCRSLREIVISPGKIKLLPPAARYTAVLTYMERRAKEDMAAGNPESGIIDDFVMKRQGNLLDLAINRRNAEAVRYMLTRRLIEPDALAEYLGKSAARSRVEITALLLEYGQTLKKENLFEEDPFA